MLPSYQRFHTKGAVRRVLSGGRPARGRNMMIRAIPGKSPAGRVAVIISKKVFKSAVKRNRVRRRIYNIVRHELCKHNPVATDMVITVFSQDVLVMEHALLQRELSYLVASSITRDRRA